jgi:endoglucanase
MDWPAGQALNDPRVITQFQARHLLAAVEKVSTGRPHATERHRLPADWRLRIVDGEGRTVLLRGVGLGGWMNMENFVTGYPSTESLMREAVRGVLGEDRADLFFDRLLTSFFDAEDVALFAELGVNCVRVPFNYHHFEDDARPFQLREEGFRHLDRVVRLCADRGIWTVLDLHALPRAQNQHWHSDNPTHVAAFWQYPHFQDRVVHLWRALAEHYRDQPWVAGYNLINEPGDPSGRVVEPVYGRIVRAVREVDPHHYAQAGLAHGGPYPGETKGVWVDRDRLERKFVERTSYQRDTGTPIWVGEFGPVDTGLQGLVCASPDGPYMRRFGPLIQKKTRLGVDRWGSTDQEVPDVIEPIHDLVAKEFPDWRPYPWGARYTTDDLVRHILFAQALLGEYAERFRGLRDEVVELADSFALRSCVRRQRLCELVAERLRG